MIKTCLLVLACLAISNCTYSDINFESMTELELMEYNRGRPLAQMIVCSEDSRSFSRVRRRRCATVEAMYGSVQEAERLGVLNTGQGLSAGGMNF